MIWQLFLAGYLVLGVGGYLLRRSLAQSLASHSRFVNGFFFLAVHVPNGLIIAAFLHPNLRIGLVNMALLAIGGAVFPIANILAYRANHEVDAGLFTILNNLRPIVTVTSAWLLLHQVLSGHQFFGAIIIVASTFLATLPNLRRQIQNRNMGLVLALASISLVGIGTTFESFMLNRIDFGAYLVWGWGLQAVWMAVWAWPERRYVRLLRDSKKLLPILGYSLSNSYKGLFFLAALKFSGSASLVSASASFMAVLVVLAASVVLQETDWLWLKLGAALVGAGGLLLINT